MGKKNFFYLMLMMIMGVGLFASCSGDDDSSPVASKLSISLSNIEKGSEGGNVEVDVTSNTKWYVSGATDWCTVAPKEGEKNGVFEVTISENTQSKERKCTLKVRTTDGAVVEEIAVTQTAKEFINVTGPIVFAKDKGNKKVMQISSNVSWEITGIPDWLDCSQRSGSNSRDVELTTKTENTKGTRTATLTVKATSSSSLSVTVQVSQEGKSGVKVTAPNLVALRNCFAFLPVLEGDVKRFKVGWIKASAYNTMSEAEVLDFARGGAPIVDFKKLVSMRNLASNTDYYLITLAYDNDDEEGEVIKTKFKTKPAGDDQAYVGIGDLYRSADDYIYWEANPDGATDKYYTIYACGLDGATIHELIYSTDDGVYFDSAKFAWMMNNEINLKSGVYKTKKGKAEIWEEKGYTIENNRIKERGKSLQLGWAIFATWGVNVSDDNLSGYLNIVNAYVSLDESGKKVISLSKEYKVPSKK